MSRWIFGALAVMLWSSRSLAQAPAPLSDISYHFGDGWTVGTSPNITANWLAKEGEQWTVPVGASIGKASRFFKQPVNISLASYYNAIRPTANKETWLVQLTVTFIFAK